MCGYATDRIFQLLPTIAHLLCFLFVFLSNFADVCSPCIGLLLIAGVAIAEGKWANSYASALEVTGALLAIISAVFLILTLVCGGGSKTAPA